MHNGKIIIRMSVNPEEIINKVEFGTSRLKGRIVAINKLVEAGYKYMEIVDQYSKEHIIVVDAKGNINIIDQDGKEILDEWITGAYGFYHIRCCAAVMAYHYDVRGSIMELYITKEGKTEEELNIYKYTIDLVTKTYEVELSDNYY